VFDRKTVVTVSTGVNYAPQQKITIFSGDLTSSKFEKLFILISHFLITIPASQNTVTVPAFTCGQRGTGPLDWSHLQIFLHQLLFCLFQFRAELVNKTVFQLANHILCMR
jgi:hypothetical protein